MLLLQNFFHKRINRLTYITFNLYIWAGYTVLSVVTYGSAKWNIAMAALFVVLAIISGILSVLRTHDKGSNLPLWDAIPMMMIPVVNFCAVCILSALPRDPKANKYGLP